MRAHKKFGEILLQAGVISKPELESALAAQALSGLALGKILEDRGLISDRDVIAILSRQFRLPFLENLDEVSVSRAALRLVDCDTAVKLGVIPLGAGKTTVEIAISNPLDFHTLDRLAFKTGRHVRPVLATPAAILKAIKRLYMQEPRQDLPSETRLLILENQEQYRAPIYSALRQDGYFPLFADTVEEAVGIVHKDAPRLVLAATDMKMVGSRVVLDQLTRGRSDSALPVIALTSNQTAEEEAFLLRLGFFDVLHKPLNYIRLRARIERALRFFHQGATVDSVRSPGRPTSATINE